MKSILDSSSRGWTISEGDGAFYGPKIDIILKDSSGKEHQTATIQLDFQLPQRFNLKYIGPGSGDSQGKVETPVLIHRAVLGSLERFLALAIEHYNGRYPFWISPRPITILATSQQSDVLAHVKNVEAQINGFDGTSTPRKAPSGRPVISVEVDTSARSLGKKIVHAKSKGFNFIAVVGPKEAANNSVSLQFGTQPQSDVCVGLLQGIAPNVSMDTNKNSAVVSPSALRTFFQGLQDEYL